MKSRLGGLGVLKIVGTLVVLGALAWVLVSRGPNFSFDTVMASARAVGPRNFFIAAMWVLLQTACQILRLWFLLPGGGKLSLGRVAYAFSLGQWINSFVPARAGDVVKAALVSKGSDETSLAHNAGVVVADKVVDLFSLLAIVIGVGSLGSVIDSMVPGGRNGWWVAAAMVLGGTAVFVLARQSVYRRFPSLLKFEGGIRCLGRLNRSVPAWMASTLSWVFEAIAILTLVRALGFELTFSQAVFCLFLLNLAIAVPVSVANVGTFEASLVFGLNRFGLGLSESVAIAGLHHVLQWLGISVWAVLTWLGQIRAERVDAQRWFHVRRKDKQRALLHYEKLSGRYDSAVNRGFLKRLRSKERQMVLSFADLTHAGQSMIDVGCGNGFYALEAKRHGLWVSAVDASAAMVESLKDRVDEARVADIDSIRMDRGFDRVVCAGVLDFVENPAVAFSNLARLVAPAGHLVVLSPRVGLGGLYYRLEKRVLGIRVNLYNLAWYAEQAAACGLQMVDHGFPLAINMVVLFRRPSLAPAEKNP